jgi:hypothetical protein
MAPTMHSAPAEKVHVHERALIREAVLGHPRRGTEDFHIGETRQQRADLGHQLANQRVELVRVE